MKITSFSVKNYRSIVEAHKINIKDYNVIIGKNNEGKSNVLKALYVCVSCINDFFKFRYNLKSEYTRDDQIYNWSRDFPIQLQERKTGKNTIFEVVLSLNEEELKEFNRLLGTRLGTKEIKMKIKIGPDNEPTISFPKKGTSTLTKRKRQVLLFLSGKISYNYIPSIRTKKTAIGLIRETVAKELKTLNANPEYKEALEKIRKLQNELLSELSENTKNELIELLPNVNDVKIEIKDEYNLGLSIRDINVLVNDGVMTNIENKGDGVNSLAVLAILKNRKNKNINSNLIAIDEPEAHLHPGAIIELNKNLKDISEYDQVIVSTHNAAFIDTENISNNIIIDSRKAKPAKNVKDIRSVLGIQVEEYMISARIILLVEGECDRKIIEHLLSQKSTKLKKALQDRELVVKEIDSASKLDYYMYLLRGEVCKVFVCFDNDESGNKSIMKQVERKLLLPNDYFILKCEGRSESELEDIIKVDVYSKYVYDTYGVNLSNKKFRTKKKWSDRLKEAFNYDGKNLDDSVLKDIKVKIVELVLENNDSFIEQNLHSINSLINRLNEVLK